MSRPTRWFPLRRRLLLLLLGGLSAAWATMLSLSYLDAHHEIDELFDAQLAQVAQTLLALADGHTDSAIGETGGAAHKYQRRCHFQIWRADGTLLLRSEHAPATPLTRIDGFSERSGDGGHVRYFSQWNREGTLQVQVGEDHHMRDELIEHIAWRLLVPALIGLPLLGVWVWLAIRQSLSPLDEVAGEIRSRAPQQLHAVAPAQAPEEIRPLLEGLNDLFRKVDQALEAERRFTADAAHELRTPLAALQAQLQVARRAHDEAERDEALASLQGGLVRAAHLVEQMLQLARLDPEQGLPSPRPLALDLLAADVCAELGPRILARDLDFELAADPGVTIVGQADWLHVLLRNLLDNAARYTPRNGRLCVTVRSASEGAILSVADSGPGIPPEARSDAMRRFHRLDPAHPEPGSGLGLSIVARVAELHGARIALDETPGGGLTVRVTFPARA